MPTCTKKDTHCLWMKHLPTRIAARVAVLEPNARIILLVNGVEMVWHRMNNGKDFRPTYGIKVSEESKEGWEKIPRGAIIEIELPDNLTPPGSTNPPHTKRQNTTIPSNTLGIKNRVPRKSAKARFDGYLMADYSGAFDGMQQRRAIRVAYIEGAGETNDIGFTVYARTHLFLNSSIVLNLRPSRELV